MPQELASLLHDFPRGDPDRLAHQFTPPNAEFASARLMARDIMSWQPGKLFLGVVGGTVEKDAKGRNYVMGGQAIGLDDDRHIITFAGSRSGKGRAAIIPNMLHYPGSVLATDPKGELATITARRRVELGQSVYVLDPFGAAKGYPRTAGLVKGFNPIAAMRENSLIEDASLISDALVVVPSDSREPHWDESARAFIEGLILHIRTWVDYGGKASLLTLREVIGQAGNLDKSSQGGGADGLRADMEMNTKAGGVIQSAAADFFQRPPNERGSVLSSARRHLKFIDLFRDPGNPNARMTLERDDFRLESLKDTPTTVYLCLPARHIGTCNRWLRLFVNLTLQGMERSGLSRPGQHPVLCVLDEFASLGHMKQIEDAAGQIAGFGVRLWPVLQDLGQLDALYEKRWQTFLGNAGIIQCFGNNDLMTLNWISERCGIASIETTRQSDVTGGAMRVGAKGETTGTEVHPLLTADEAARKFGRDDPLLRQLVIWAGRKNPLLVMQRAYYDHHELFRERGRANGAKLFDDPP